MFTLGLTNTAHLQKYKIRYRNHIILFYEPFYVADVVEKIDSFLKNLVPESSAKAKELLRQIFWWEFEGNTLPSLDKYLSNGEVIKLPILDENGN